MPIGSRTTAWLEALHGTPCDAKTKAARRLLRLNESYFNNNKVSPDERLAILAALAVVANDSEAVVRQCVAQMLGLLQLWNDEACDLLSALLHDQQPEVHVHAIWAAVHIGQGAVALCPLIARLARSPLHDVRWRVAWALGQLGCKSAEVRSALLLLAHDPSHLARMYSIQSFARCARAFDNEVRHRLAIALDDPDDSVRAAACRAIAALAWDWNDTLPKIRRLALCDKGGVQVDAMLALISREPQCVHDPPVRAWLEANRGYWWVDDLFSDQGNDA